MQHINDRNKERFEANFSLRERATLPENSSRETQVASRRIQSRMNPRGGPQAEDWWKLEPGGANELVHWVPRRAVTSRRLIKFANWSTE